MSRSRSCETTCSLIVPAPRTQNQRAAFAQFSEDALRQFHSGRSHGHRSCAQFGFGPYPLPYLQRSLKQAVQHRPGSAMFMCKAISFPHLPQDFRFAQHHRIQSRSNAEKMTHRFTIIVVI
jgi:hypothetical protein